VEVLARGRRILRGSRRGGGRRLSRINPTRMDAAVQTVGRFGIDRIAVQNEAPERHLDVAAGAAEPVVKVEMPEGRIQVVAPEQAYHPAAEPDAFRIAGRTIEGALRFGKLIDFLDLFGAVFGALFGRRRLLVGGLGVVILRQDLVLRQHLGVSRSDRGDGQAEGGAQCTEKIEYAIRHSLLRWALMMSRKGRFPSCLGACFGR